MEEQEKQELKPIWVKPETHQKVKVRAALLEKTMSETIDELLEK